MRHIIFAFIALLLSQDALSHARLLSAPRAGTDPLQFMSPAPRDTIDGYKLFAGSVAPCGNNVKSAIVPTYTQGQMIKFEWEETIQHLGYFVFQISSDNGTNWTTIAEYDDDQNNNATPHLYPSAAKANFRVPLPANLVCDSCVVRFIQHMNETKVAHANVMDNVDYFSCADIKIVAANGGGTPPPPPPVTPPAPTPSGNSSQSSTTMNNQKLPSLSSCGMIARNSTNNDGMPPAQMALLLSLLLLPLFLVQSLKLQEVARRRKNY